MVILLVISVGNYLEWLLLIPQKLMSSGNGKPEEKPEGKINDAHVLGDV